ncbi:hypothetical protein [Streptomyces spiramenti]|uniref:Uncharacterized protein n=1 Tax=Streptomyces spiramenti TaxID=2720606 RepID=A0ABX1AEQ1_9ACTN|nr:hypothetical protein [Streptomyces spiramenti]NJP65679.1 hypothetical protein [Streptomyces spiramenti]
MLDTAALERAVDTRADRLRRLPERRLRGAAADAALTLARELAARAQRLEEPGTTPRVLPDAGYFAVGDQVAVAGHDLAHALRHHGTAVELQEALALVSAAARG